jgi:hypothetical protein
VTRASPPIGRCGGLPRPSGDEALCAEVQSYPGVSAAEPAGAQRPAADVVVALRVREGDRELAFISTISIFGTAIDVTLSELSIEAFYPANAATAMRLLSEIDAA